MLVLFCQSTMNFMRKRICFLVWLLACGCWIWGLPGSAQAENWGHWRGPFFNGSTSEKNLPAKFSKTENVLWSADLPGPSAATPIIWGNHVILTAADKGNKSFWAIALDHATGRILWQRQVGAGNLSHDSMSNYASPSPVTDGQVVVFFFGNGEMAAFDFQGQKLWSRNIQTDYGTFAFLYNFSSSPLIWGGKLYLQVLQRNVPVNGRGRRDGPNDSYLLALEPQTGKELWRQIRPSEAVAESCEAFTSPVIYTDKERTELLIAGGDCITAHDPVTGKELWRWGTWNPNRISHWRLVPSPVAGEGAVLVCAPKGGAVYAVKADGNGNLNESALAWKNQDRTVTSDVATPLYYKGRFYVLNSNQERKYVSCLEPATGKVIWTGELKSRVKIEASPTGADDKIYAVNFKGDVFVIGTGDTFELLGTAEMGADSDNQVRSSVSIAQGHLFVRTESKLFCLSQKD